LPNFILFLFLYHKHDNDDDESSTVKIPFVDEIVGAIVTKAKHVNALSNTIVLFVSLPDNDESAAAVKSTIEINIRRTALVYSPLLKLQQRVSNQMMHVIDLLPTLVNATSLKWRTRDRIYIDGINQWPALNANDEERLDVYGDNFYISNYWKLSFGTSSNDSSSSSSNNPNSDDDSNESGIAKSYGSLANENMESNHDATGYDFATYKALIFASELHAVLNTTPPLTAEKIMFLRSRAKVHCNLNDVDESTVAAITCSRTTPCLFNLLEDPCEFDDKFEADYDARRNHMQNHLVRYLNGESFTDISNRNNDVTTTATPAAHNEDDDMWIVAAVLGGIVFACISAFIIVVCVKEKCNRKRSVYHARASKTVFVDQSDAKVQNGTANGAPSPQKSIAVAVISH